MLNWNKFHKNKISTKTNQINRKEEIKQINTAMITIIK
jgi:hypothetical protein